MAVGWRTYSMVHTTLQKGLIPTSCKCETKAMGKYLLCNFDGLFVYSFRFPRHLTLYYWPPNHSSNLQPFYTPQMLILSYYCTQFRPQKILGTLQWCSAGQ